MAYQASYLQSYRYMSPNRRNTIGKSWYSELTRLLKQSEVKKGCKFDVLVLQTVTVTVCVQKALLTYNQIS